MCRGGARYEWRPGDHRREHRADHHRRDSAVRHHLDATVRGHPGHGRDLDAGRPRRPRHLTLPVLHTAPRPDEHPGHRAAPLHRAASLTGAAPPYSYLVHVLIAAGHGNGYWVVVWSGRIATAMRSAASAGGPCGI